MFFRSTDSMLYVVVLPYCSMAAKQLCKTRAYHSPFSRQILHCATSCEKMAAAAYLYSQLSEIPRCKPTLNSCTHVSSASLMVRQLL